PAAPVAGAYRTWKPLRRVQESPPQDRAKPSTGSPTPLRERKMKFRTSAFYRWTFNPLEASDGWKRGFSYWLGGNFGTSLGSQPHESPVHSTSCENFELSF